MSPPPVQPAAPSGARWLDLGHVFGAAVWGAFPADAVPAWLAPVSLAPAGAVGPASLAPAGPVGPASAVYSPHGGAEVPGGPFGGQEGYNLEKPLHDDSF